ncbi:MAG: hypothetical protein JXR53_03730 [Bacteroidales bacterium]|nr:hypothetical protein [Bacteroidales bacterium]
MRILVVFLLLLFLTGFVHGQNIVYGGYKKCLVYSQAFNPDSSVAVDRWLIQENKYDKHGNIIKGKNYHLSSQPKVSTRKKFLYNQFGYIIEERYESKKRKNTVFHTIIVNDNGLIIRDSVNNLAFNYPFVDSLIYNDAQKLILLTRIDSAGTIFHQEEYSYSEEGLMDTIWSRSRSGEIVSITFFYDASGLISRKEEYDSDLMLSAIESYDQFGNIISIKILDGFGRLKTLIEYEYY